MSGANRTRLVLAVAVGVVAFAVWAVSETQRSTAERVFDESRAAGRMQTAMLDQETGLRGFALTRERPYLQPFIDGVRDFNDASADASELATSDEQRRLDRPGHSHRQPLAPARRAGHRLRRPAARQGRVAPAEDPRAQGAVRRVPAPRATRCSASSRTSATTSSPAPA